MRAATFLATRVWRWFADAFEGIASGIDVVSDRVERLTYAPLWLWVAVALTFAVLCDAG